ncbi:spore germination protein GerW family protein [Nocardia sp. N2S4-5]|uniref:spore germination protein GerW family protein n=1 Tax=Nocardia sp. N2S4-5 TaxID=3351565 RepID=UPI0037CD410E
MTSDDHDTAPQPDAPGEVHTLLHRLAERIGESASAAAVFGEPVVAEGVTVIPVARARLGFGAGIAGEPDVGRGGGGGGGVDVRPVGFVEIRGGSAVYRPIRDPWVDIVVPLAALVAGLTVPRLLRGRIRVPRLRER